ncbi:LysR family transcriptional regulator [Meridianimarinicoccus roseus]|jgi:LysR family glycine cleavage system transcriptional activator|nr:LysR family transcriptional regulator [Meridianimarinicoccus roseus]
MPPLTALRAFAALAETRSASRAGAALNVSHAAISQHVRALEARLNVALVRRDGRGLALTEDGQALATVLLGAFGDIRTALDALSEAENDRPLQVSATPNFAANWLMPRLSDFRARHPDIELMINPSPDLVQVGRDGFDVAIRFGDGRWPGLAVEPLIETNIVILAARDLIGDRPIDGPSDLLDLPWLQELGTDEVTTWLARHGVTERRTRRMTHLPGNFVLEAIRRGDGIAATARAFAESDIASGRLLVLYEDATPGAGYHIVTSPGVPRPAARAFTAWLRRQAGGQAVTVG